MMTFYFADKDGNEIEAVIANVHDIAVERAKDPRVDFNTPYYAMDDDDDGEG
ncbi:MAG: hypothetical protein GQ474_05935 [Sulfurimonas sp.]|nr:hypothetical protein [Sulfurimonas sp.]